MVPAWSSLLRRGRSLLFSVRLMISPAETTSQTTKPILRRMSRFVGRPMIPPPVAMMWWAGRDSSSSRRIVDSSSLKASSPSWSKMSWIGLPARSTTRESVSTRIAQRAGKFPGDGGLP